MNRRSLLGSLLSIPLSTSVVLSQESKLEKLPPIGDYLIDVFEKVYGSFIFEPLDEGTVKSFCNVLKMVFEMRINEGGLDYYLITARGGDITVILEAAGNQTKKTLVLGKLDGDDLIFMSGMSEPYRLHLKEG